MEITTRPRRHRARGLMVNVLCGLVSLIALGFILPAAFGLQRYVIAGGSMTGTINLGSVVFDDVVPVTDLKVGDVITYMPPASSGIDHLVTHRIISINGDRFHTKGDANQSADPWRFRLTAATQPRVAFHVPYVGYVFLALQDRDTRMLVIGVPAAIVALLSLVELLGGLRRRPEGVEAPQMPAATVVPAQPGPEQASALRTRPARPTTEHRTPTSPVAS